MSNERILDRYSYYSDEWSHIGINKITDEKVLLNGDTIKRTLILQTNLNKAIMSNKLALCKAYENVDSVKDYLDYIKKDILHLYNPNERIVQARRVDFAEDIEYNSVSEVNAVIEMLKCCNLSGRCHWKTEQHFKTSVYDVNQSYQINFYNKSQERNDRGELEEAELTEKIFRAEVQCNSPKLKTLRKSYGKNNNTFLFYCSHQFEVVEQCIDTNFTTGNFYSLEKAKEKINANFSTAKANHMIKCIECINQKRIKDRRKVIENILNSKDPNIKPSTFKGYKRDLEKIGVSVFTLPIRLCKELGKDELINPYQKLQSKKDNNC